MHSRVAQLLGLLLVLVLLLVAPFDRAVATAKQITVNNAAQLKQIKTLGQGKLITAIWSPDAKTLAVASSIGISLLDKKHLGGTETLKAASSFLENHGTMSIAFNANGTMLAAGNDDATIRLWDVKTGTARTIPTGQEGGVDSIAFSPDGSVLASGISSDTAGFVLLWDVKTGSLQTTIPTTPSGPSAWERVAFSPDGTLLAYRDTTDNGVIRLREMKTGHERAVLDVQQSLEMGDLVFSPDSKLLAAPMGGGDLQIWDTHSGKMTQDISVNNGEAEPVSAVAFSHNGATIVTGSGYTGLLQVWNVKTGVLKTVLKNSAKEIEAQNLSVALNPVDDTLAAASSDGVVQLWNITKGQKIAAIGGYGSALTSVAFSPNGLLAAGGDDILPTVWVWNLETGQQQAVLQGHERNISAVAFSPDGKLLASSSFDQTVRLWNAKTGINTATMKGFIKDLNANNWLYDVAFSPNGSMVATAGDDALEGKVWLWKTNDESQPLVLNGIGSLYSLAFSPDGSLIAAGDLDGEVILWDTKTGDQRTILQTGESTGILRIISDVAFSPDGSVLAAAREDWTITLWDVKTSTQRTILQVPNGSNFESNLAIAFNKDGSVLASTAPDDSAYLWNVATGTQLGALPYTSPLSGVAFSPDGATLATTAADGTAQLWELP